MASILPWNLANVTGTREPGAWRTHPATVPPRLSFGPEDRKLLAEQIERIMGSDAFRGSKRSREFLAHIVERALDGGTDLLKERLIGVHLYGKDGGYDTAVDSTVRVRANEVRRRLLQYAEQFGRDEAFRIVLPSGSYVPEFQRSTGRPAPGIRPAVRQSQLRSFPPLQRRWLIGPTIVALLLCGLAFGWMVSPASIFKQFWQPLMIPNQEIFLVVQPDSLDTSSNQNRELLSFPTIRNLLKLHDICAKFNMRTEVLLTNQNVFAPEAHSVQILLGKALQTSALGPASRLRYRLESVNGIRIIVDTATNRQYLNTTPGSSRERSYALVTRVVPSTSYPSTLALSGTSDTAVSAAAELVTDQATLGSVLHEIGAESMQRDLQILLAVQHSGAEIWKNDVLSVQTYP